MKIVPVVVGGKHPPRRADTRLRRIAAPAAKIGTVSPPACLAPGGVSKDRGLRLAVGIATVGRPLLLRAVVDELMRQTRPADRIVICAPTADDMAGVAPSRSIEIVVGPRGLTRQRNAIIERVEDCDLLQFFDDDFVPATTYLAEIEHAFVEWPDVVMVTGSVIADGIIGPGFDIDEALHRLAVDVPSCVDTVETVANGYGCNMAARLSAVRAAQYRFDENLPLYGWLEDVDFSLQLARHGRIVKLSAARGVHLGVKQGRQSGVRLGYSQIANPIYLSRKGTCPWPRALRQIGRNMAMNLARALHPEPYVDRAGRVVGNLKAVRDLITGRLDPQRILEL
jgi:GT2 family glycosyltransferase